MVDRIIGLTHDRIGTGTPVRGGLTFREAHYICEAIAETGCLVGLDIMVSHRTSSTMRLSCLTTRSPSRSLNRKSTRPWGMTSRSTRQSRSAALWPERPWGRLCYRGALLVGETLRMVWERRSTTRTVFTANSMTPRIHNRIYVQMVRSGQTSDRFTASPVSAGECALLRCDYAYMILSSTLSPISAATKAIGTGVLPSLMARATGYRFLLLGTFVNYLKVRHDCRHANLPPQSPTSSMAAARSPVHPEHIGSTIVRIQKVRLLFMLAHLSFGLFHPLDPLATLFTHQLSHWDHGGIPARLLQVRPRQPVCPSCELLKVKSRRKGGMLKHKSENLESLCVIRKTDGETLGHSTQDGRVDTVDSIGPVRLENR